ncbi:hypothetical protein NQ176_g3841 [Zarea fungicola]|uniref:Uncharacterized protein n=1 Tax=Zarea fungicola TaxID=93591 RepID=A0ACC1NH52_9HYPO|nr:hypothetical protein NQ176_g3841 [Lecanicillium fungicola]
MDSIFSFGPLWSQDECITDTTSATEHIKSIALRICLERNRLGSEESPGLDDLLDDVLHAIESLLWNEQNNNIIIDRIIAFSAEEDIDPVLLVKEAIALWYISAVPISVRDPHQGFKPDAEVEIEDGHTIIRWNRQYAAKQHELANLGLIAMLLTSETWSRPEHPSLRFGTLVANAVTTILLGTFIILPKIENIKSTNLLVSSLKQNEAMRLYLRTSWQLAQKGTTKYASSPSAEFGANDSELKIDYNGRRLLTKIGRETWKVASEWHPCRKTPGSPWNKFMKNKKQPYFPKKAKKTSLQYQIPSSCLSLAAPWENYYSELRTRFDNTHRERVTLSEGARAAQFRRLACKTGLPYPAREHSENAAHSTYDIDQEYLYNIPMIKKNINDLRGNLSLPFITSAIRGLRFEREPDEMEGDLFMMRFRQHVSH